MLSEANAPVLTPPSRLATPWTSPGCAAKCPNSKNLMDLTCFSSTRPTHLRSPYYRIADAAAMTTLWRAGWRGQQRSCPPELRLQRTRPHAARDRAPGQHLGKPPLTVQVEVGAKPVPL